MILKKKIITVIVLIISINSSCNTNKSTHIDARDVVRVEIINKTKKKFVVSSLSFSDKKKVELVIDQMNNLKVINTEVNTKSNSGYFDISVMLIDGSVIGIDVLDTEYDGSVIVNVQNSERYRNDKLNNLIMALFKEDSGKFQ